MPRDTQLSSCGAGFAPRCLALVPALPTAVLLCGLPSHWEHFPLRAHRIPGVFLAPSWYLVGWRYHRPWGCRPGVLPGSLQGGILSWLAVVSLFVQVFMGRWVLSFSSQDCSPGLWVCTVLCPLPSIIHVKPAFSYLSKVTLLPTFIPSLTSQASFRMS